MLVRSCVLLLSLGTVFVAQGFSVSRVAPACTRGQRTICTELFAEETSSDGEEAAEETKEEGDESPAPPVNDILNSPAFLQKKLEVVKSDIAKMDEEVTETSKKLEVEKEEWKPQLDSLDRELQNIQSRISGQSNQASDAAKVEVVKKVLEFLDNFDRAFGLVTPETDEDKEVEADYKATYNMILDIFGKLGVEEIETVGAEFDYNLHQAVMQMPSDEYEEGMVCQEFQKGYKIGDELVRTAFVGVAM